MRIVFVLGSYLPKCSAVGNCVKNLVDVLENEHQVTVICQARSSSEVALERFSNHEIVRVYTPLQNLRADIEGSPEGEVRSMRLFSVRLARVINIALPVGSIDSSLVRAYREALDSLPHCPDLLVPTCLPFEACVACARYAEGKSDVRLVPYLFDQFADSKTINRPAFMANIKRGANLRLEKEVFSRSNRVLQITWGDHIQAHFPDIAEKFVHVEHPLLVRPTITSQTEVSENTVYAGALDATVRNPAFSLEVLSNVLSGGEFGPANFYVPNHEKFVGFFEEAQSDAIRLLPSIPPDEVRAELAKATWLLSIGNATGDQKVSKIYEYMAFGKPIIHFYSKKDDETASELSRYPIACCLYEDDGIEACSRKLRIFLTSTRGATVPFSKVAELFPEELPSCVTDTLLCAGGGYPSMIFAGAFTAKVRPDYLLSLIDAMGSSTRVDIKTSDTWVERLEKEPPFRSGQCTVGPWVDAAVLPTLYEEHDALLSIAEHDGKQLSSKIFSYMGTGKPVVHIYYADDDVNVRYLRKYPLALCIQANADRLVENVRLTQLFLLWSLGRRLSQDEVEKRFESCTPRFISRELLRCATAQSLCHVESVN